MFGSSWCPDKSEGLWMWTLQRFPRWLRGGSNFGAWPHCWVIMEFLHAPIPRKGSGSTTTNMVKRNLIGFGQQRTFASPKFLVSYGYAHRPCKSTTIEEIYTPTYRVTRTHFIRITCIVHRKNCNSKGASNSKPCDHEPDALPPH